MTDRELALVLALLTKRYIRATASGDILAQARTILSVLREHGYVLCPTPEHEELRR